MRVPLLTAALITLALPAQAQDAITAETLLQTFTDRCAAIAADPEAAIAAAVRAGEGSGAVTTDKAILQLTAVMDLPGASFATLFYTRLVMPADRQESCALTVSFDAPGTPIVLPGLADLVGTRAADLLGAPATRRGSDVFSDGELARSYIWSTGDSVNDPSLSVTQTSTYVLLSTNRRSAAN